ncbi:MAG: hypothetical protein Q8880_13505, partial [Bacteroidota bacterium]|nr:hypothetical protein [Bacteroidota bacterium]
NIVGKSVNLTFDKFQMTNFNNTYTSSTGKTYGICIDKKTYTDGDGRPEGLIFTNSLVFGANTNLNIQSALLTKIENVILDAASEDCVIINVPDNVTVKGCYIAILNDNYAGIRFTNEGDTVINILDNWIIGSSTSTGIQYGIYCDQINKRYGISIQNNLIEFFSTGIFGNYVNQSNIINNHGRHNRGALIYLQSDCADTKVDGNTTNDKYPILKLHPTTSDQVKIGDNFSGTTRTSYQGVGTIKAGTTIASAGNGFYKEELYFRAVTLIQPVGNLGNVWVTPETFYSDATIQCSAAPSTDTKVYYKTIAVPYSALN